MTKLSINELPGFLATLKTDSLENRGYTSVSISSPTDTINNKAFILINNFLASKKTEIYTIRNWTEEEQFVTTAKMNNKKYSPDSVDWKIGFDIKFVPPTDTTNTQ